ncbi:MAG: response regulator transcription factor [Cyanobacteria bacterium P01_G01_bin.39]
MIIKILLADDQRLIREGIKAILKQEPEIKVVGTAQDGKSAIAQVKKLQPDIVLIDIEMPKMNGITATKYICQCLPDTKVIVLTSHKNDDYLAQAIEAGASGYLLKNSLLHELTQAIYALSKDCNTAPIMFKRLNRGAAKIPAANIDRHQQKITYLRKYRASIYKPRSHQRHKQRLLTRARSSQATDFGITKANLAPIFSDFDAKEMLVSHHHSKLNSSPDFDRQRYLRRIGLLLIAIASFVLSIIIFK